MRILTVFLTIAVVVTVVPACVAADAKLTVETGPINSVLIESGDHCLAIYGGHAAESKTIDQVFLPHSRRDLTCSAVPLFDGGVKVTAPERERYFLESPQEFWEGFRAARFHDYAQQTTKISATAIPVDRWVKDGDVISWRNLSFKVIETPGYTRGSVSYVARVDGRQVAFTGDLIYGDGQILDLYSFQDAIPDAQVRGYHGYGARLSQLVESLRRIAAEEPDLIVPARGPVITDPQDSIQRLISRVQGIYRNYLSTNALHWYFKEERMRKCGERVLGEGAEMEFMPYSHHEETPAWVFEHSTSRLLISDTGHAFLLDCGYQRVIDAINELISQKIVKQVDGIFVTHYHDDHTDMVQAAAEEFQCPVYATEQYADVLLRPRAYHLPAMTANPIRDIQVVDDGHQMPWHEFRLTFYFFPGQTWYHGALFAEKGEEVPIFFIGDAFAPSGIDDYCVLNRNLLHEDSGYLYCIEKLRGIKKPFWLVNEHIPFVFSFSTKELDYLGSRYRERIAIMRDLFPWDDPNYGIDEQWAVLDPHGISAPSGAYFDMEMRITNHSPVDRAFDVTPHVPEGWTIAPNRGKLRLKSRQHGAIPFRVTTGKPAGTFLITADVFSDGMNFREWAEAVITVE